MSDLAAAAAARAASRATRTITTGQIDLALSWARGEITLADAEKLIGKTGPPYPLLARSLAEAVRSGRLVEGGGGDGAPLPEVVVAVDRCVAWPYCERARGHEGACDPPIHRLPEYPATALPCPYTGCQRGLGHAGDCAANFTSQTEK